jgi:uncharacterized protein YxjI
VDVTIQERKVSFTAEYDITTPSATYYAKKAFFSLTDHLELQESDGRTIATIQGAFSPLKHKHDITFIDGRQYHFHCDDLWSRVYLCEGNNASYSLYEHKGLRCSIFRQDRKVAAFTKNRIVWGSGNKYEIRVDSDADLALILCMVLSVSLSEDNDKDNSVTIDLGNIGPEGRPFDEEWQPR